MLNSMRERFNQLKWILLAVVAAFVFGFVFIDMGLGGAPLAGGDDRAYAARVNGQTITFREFDRALYYTEQQYKQNYGAQLTPEVFASMGIPAQVLNSLVDQRLLIQEAERLDLDATQEEVRKRIMDIPVLSQNGKFVGTELYSRWTQQLGYQTPSEFEDEISRDITSSKMESALASSIVISPKTAESEYRRQNESAKIRYVLYPASREAAAVTVTPAEAEQYYKANQANYAHGEQRYLKYLVADFARLRSQITPSDEQLRRHYDSTKEQYKSNEAARIQHILIKVDPGATPEADLAAKTKAESIVAQIRGGADFAALAKANSADPSSSAQGGEMGWVERGQTVDAFDRAAFSVALNTVSDPIRTPEYGYHIIRVHERRPAAFRAFEEVRSQVAAQVADQMAKDQAREQMNRINAQIKAKKPNTPEEFAAYANDKVSSNDTQWFGKGESLPGIGFNQPLTTWVFSAKQGDIGEVVGTQRGIVIPYLVNIRPAGITPLAEVKDRVDQDARAEKARQAALNSLRTASAGATSVDAIAPKAGLAAADTTINRGGSIQGFTGDTTELVKATMSAQVGQVVGPIVVGDGAVVFQVTEQHKVSPEELKEKVPAYMEVLRSQQARSLRSVLLERLRNQAKIDINQQALQNSAPNPRA